MTTALDVNDTVELRPGDFVIATGRLPSTIQWWIHPIWVGQILAPGDDPTAWNGSNSERDYCQACGYTPVQYSFRPEPMHDSTAELRPLDELPQLLSNYPHDATLCAVLPTGRTVTVRPHAADGLEELLTVWQSLVLC